MKGYELGWLLLLATGIARGSEYHPVYLDADDPDAIDAEDSLEYAYSEPRRASFGGDLRGGYFNSEVDLRDGGKDYSDEFALRFRYGANLGFTDQARLKARLATTCTDSSCDPDVDIASRPGNGANINDGDLVFDEFYRMSIRCLAVKGALISALAACKPVQ